MTQNRIKVTIEIDATTEAHALSLLSRISIDLNDRVGLRPQLGFSGKKGGSSYFVQVDRSRSAVVTVDDDLRAAAAKLGYVLGQRPDRLFTLTDPQGIQVSRGGERHVREYLRRRHPHAFDFAVDPSGRPTGERNPLLPTSNVTGLAREARS